MGGRLSGVSAVWDRLAWDRVVFGGGVNGTLTSESVPEWESLVGDSDVRSSATPYTDERPRLITEAEIRETSIVVN